MRPTIDEYFIYMARLSASRSTCLRRSVGCVLTNVRGHVLATGYNGVAARMPHCHDQSIKVYARQADADPEQEFERLCYDLDSAGAVYDSCGITEDIDGDIGQVWHVPVYPNACPGARAASGQQLDKCQAIHAEQNALLQCRDVWEIENCYTTSAPCVHCIKLLLNTSCQRIVYLAPYDEGALALWTGAGRVAEQAELRPAPGGSGGWRRVIPA